MAEEQKSDPLAHYRASSLEELLAIRAEFRQQDHDRAMEGQKSFAQHHHALRMNAMNVAAEHGKAFVRSCVILNGGAIAALLALMGAIYGRTDGAGLTAALALARKLQTAFLYFGCGLTAAVLLSAVAAVQWAFSAGTYFGEGQTSNMIKRIDMFGGLDKGKTLADFDWNDRGTEIALVASGIVGALSLAAFATGAWHARNALIYYSLLR